MEIYPLWANKGNTHLPKELSENSSIPFPKANHCTRPMARDDFVKVGLWTATTQNWMEEPVLFGDGGTCNESSRKTKSSPLKLKRHVVTQFLD
jgi:hypothetical protein